MFPVIEARCQSVARLVPWTAAVPEKYRAGSELLPAKVTCPVCKADAMTAYEDGLCGGQWLHCKGCGFAGDPLELAAASSGRSLASVVAGLIDPSDLSPSRRATSASLDHYLEHHVGYRKRVNEFWDACRVATPVHDSGLFDGVLRRFGVDPRRVGDSRWKAKCGRFVGFTTRDQLGPSRAFKGRGWGDLLVVPFYDLPGRVVGFVTAGRGGGPGDVVYKQVSVPREGADRSREAGVGLLDAVSNVRSLDGAVLVADADVAVSLQLRHLADHEDPLPLVAAYHGPGHATVGTFAATARPTRFVFATSKLDFNVAQARKTGGRVSSFPPQRFGDKPPLPTARLVADAATGWEAAVERAMTTLAPEDAERLVASASFTHDELVRFYEGSPAATRKVLEPLVTGVWKNAAVAVSGKKVRRTERGWYTGTAQSPELVTDAPFRVDRLVASQAGDRYEGAVLFRGKEVPFSAETAAFEKDPFGWVSNLLIRKRAGVPTSNRSWSKYAVHVAQQFHPPELVSGADVVGWDADSASMAFPGFSVGRGGVTVLARRPPADLPCAAFEPPRGLEPDEVDALSGQGQGVAAFWAVVACLLADALAPAKGWPRQRLALGGPHAATHGLAAAALAGCKVVTAGGGVPGLVAGVERYGVHAWPVAVSRPRGSPHESVVSRAAEGLPSGVAVPVSSVTAAVLRSRGWNAVFGPFEGCAVVGDAGESAVPNYLAWAAKAGYEVTGNRPPALAVLDSLADWFDSAGGDGSVVRNSDAFLAADGRGDPGGSLGWLVGRAIASGLMEVIPAAVRKPKPTSNCFFSLGDGTTYVPPLGLADALSRAGAPAIDPVSWGEALAGSGVLLDERSDGWVVPDSTWRMAIGDGFSSRRKLRRKFI